MKTEFKSLPDDKVKMSGMVEKKKESNVYNGLIELVVDKKESKNKIDFRVNVNKELNYHMSYKNYGEKSSMVASFGDLFKNLDKMSVNRAFKIDDGSLGVMIVKSIDGEKVRETSKEYRGKLSQEARSSYLIDTSGLESVQMDVQEFPSEVSTYYIDPLLVDMTDAMIEEITQTVDGASNDLLDKARCQIDCALEYLSDTWDCLKKGDIFGECQENAVSKYDNCLSRC